MEEGRWVEKIDRPGDDATSIDAQESHDRRDLGVAMCGMGIATCCRR